jgi:hypothetical protein
MINAASFASLRMNGFTGVKSIALGEGWNVLRGETGNVGGNGPWSLARSDTVDKWGLQCVG